MRLVRTLAALAALALAALPAHATTFTLGEFVSYSQGSWGQDPACNQFGCNAAAVLENNFDSIFARFNGLVEVGVPGPAGFSVIFDGPDPIITYLPASGAPGPLTVDLLDPVTTASSALGGELVTATLNVMFSNDACWRIQPASRSATWCCRTSIHWTTPASGPEIAQLDGVPVHELLSEADLLLGGAPEPVHSARDVRDPE